MLDFYNKEVIQLKSLRKKFNFKFFYENGYFKIIIIQCIEILSL